MRKKEYCQPEIKVRGIGAALMSATSNTLPVSDEIVTEDEQLSKEAPGWWANDDFWFPKIALQENTDKGRAESFIDEALQAVAARLHHRDELHWKNSKF